jgi:hypothetical protein
MRSFMQPRTQESQSVLIVLVRDRNLETVSRSAVACLLLSSNSREARAEAVDEYAVADHSYNAALHAPHLQV